MKLCDYKGYEIRVPMSGGKAGKGKNETSTIQVFDGVCVVKQIRFKVCDQANANKAAQKARAFIDERTK